MTPWQIADDSESSQQKALFAWANCAAKHGFLVANNPLGYAEATRIKSQVEWTPPVTELAYMFAIPNGGLRDKITAARMKGEGVKPGVPDILLPVSRRFDNYSCGLFIEMKKPSAKPKTIGKGGISQEQSEYMAFLGYQGYSTVVCYDWLDAAYHIMKYINGPKIKPSIMR